MRFLLLWLIIFFGGMETARAHHVVGSSSATNASFNPYSSQLRAPGHFLGFSFNVDHLDAGLGDVVTYQLSGEYSVTKKVSVGARLPFVSVRENFLPHANDIGDFAVSFKAQVKEWTESKTFLNLGSEFIFPTGSETKGTGDDDYRVAPYITISKGFKPLTVLISAGSTFALADSFHPSADYGVSVLVPLTKETLPVDAFISLQGSTLIRSSIFVSGSSKIYLKPALVFHLTPKLLTSLGAKISVIDTLDIKPGIALAQQSTAPLSDVERGFVFDMNYSF